jgi:phosphosulfolactate phosphohydrolase-like enzyme
MPTPGAIRRKAFLFEGGVATGVVITDVTRCSTTLLAAFAHGARAVRVAPKSEGVRDDQRTLDSLHATLFPGVPYVTAGELHGKPIPGAAFGNSPRDVHRDAVVDKVIYYYSTNFGTAFREMVAAIRAAGRNWNGRVYMATLVNAEAVAAALLQDRPERFLIIGGGFYDNSSIEDLVLGGRIISRMGVPKTLYDDEALLMFLAAEQLSSDAELLAAMQNNWIGRALAFYGMKDDLPALVNGTGLDPDTFQKMRFIVPELRFVQGTPFWFSTAVMDHAVLPCEQKGETFPQPA